MRRLWRRLARLIPAWMHPPHPPANGAQAAAAVAEAKHKLAQARRDWPDVREAHDDLASWFSEALGHGDRT